MNMCKANYFNILSRYLDILATFAILWFTIDIQQIVYQHYFQLNAHIVYETRSLRIEV